MRILFLTQSTQLGPSSRYRVYQLIPALTKLGIECTVSPAIDDATYTAIYRQGGGTWGKAKALRRSWLTRQTDLERLDQFDAVVSQNGFLPGISTIETVFARRKPLVFDFDDAIYLPRVGGNRLLQWLHAEHRVQTILKSAAHITAGNSVLAGYARPFNPHVTIVPSSINLTHYPSPYGGTRAVASSSDALTASGSEALKFFSSYDLSSPRPGWIGSRSTLPYLKQLKPVFDALQNNPIVIASGDPSILGYPVDFRQWTMETEMSDLREIGIGLAPLPDTPWENGKCGVKLLQYMACGIPAIASPVGVHKDIIQHGVNGFLATSTEKWITYLKQLMQDADLRQHLGSAARRTVEDRYTTDHAAASLDRAIRQAVGTHGR